jgi:hypothetical protein
MNTIQTEYGITKPVVTTKAANTTGKGTFWKAIQKSLNASEVTESAPQSAEDYKKYLEKRFGPVTLQSIGKDQKSLEAVGKRMRGNDVYIAPNIFDKMVNDRETANYYEKKISYFFTDVIPNGEAYAKSIGLTFEPCGVVIHEDGTVTYICGGGDPPEKVAKVAAENQAKREKQAKRRKELAELSAERALLQRKMWEAIVKPPSISLPSAGGNLNESDAAEFVETLKIRSLTSPLVSVISEPAADQFFYHMM